MAYGGTWLVWGSTGWFMIVLGQCRAVLVVENNIWHKIYHNDLYNFFFSDARSFGRASDNHAEPFHWHRYQVDLKLVSCQLQNKSRAKVCAVEDFTYSV